MGVVGVLWVLYGYSLAFGDDMGNLFGDPSSTSASRACSAATPRMHSWPEPGGRCRSRRRRQHPAGSGTLQADGLRRVRLIFTIITVALISGAVADPSSLSAGCLFAGALGDGRLLPGRALGIRVRRGDRRYGGWIATSSRPSTSPVVRRCTSTPVRRAWCWRSSSASARVAEGPDEAAQPAVRHARRRHAVVRLVRLQRRLGVRRGGTAGSTLVNTTARHRRRVLGWLIVERIRDGHATSWVPPPASSPAWSRSPRPAVGQRRSARW